MAREIPLTKGRVAIVDDEDFELAARYKWRFRASNRTGYAEASSSRKNGYRAHLALHRLIIGAQPGQVVDHINGDGLDCRKANLRFVTNQQNCMNRRPRRDSKSRFKGVYVFSSGQTIASIRKDGIVYHLGSFRSEEDAAAAYDQKAVELFGEFARTNFVS